MAMSVHLRNRIVGLTIVASTILIFLPVILSKDLIKNEDANAVAITSEGAVHDANGNLQRQPYPNNELALNMNQEAVLATNGNGVGVSANRPLMPSQNQNAPANNNANSSSNDRVEMLSSSHPQNALGPAPLPSNNKANSSNTEILMADNKKPSSSNAASKPSSSSTEILVAKPNNAKKPAPAPAPAQKPAASSSSGPKVIAGTKPAERYVIQVGVFSKRANADNVVKKIQQAGISVYAIEVNSNGRDLYRVYAGRANNRNELTAQSARIDKLCGTKSKVVAL